jgi:hypothetical protein
MNRRSLLKATGTITLYLPLMLHALGRSTRLAPYKYEEADGSLRVQVSDLSPLFLDFFAAARETADPEARFRIWKEKYGFAAVPPTPEGDRMARELVDAAWPRYADALKVIRAGAQAMQPQPLPVLKSVAKVLKPDAPVTVRVNAYVGGFEVNAFTYGQDDVPVVCVPIEMAPDVRGPVFTHEMTHAVHMAIAHLSGGWERSIAATALQEGLAMQVTREALPGLPITDYVGGAPGWWDRAQPAKVAVLKGALPLLEKKDSQTVYDFTIGQGTTGLQREAYIVGWFVVERLRADGMDLPAIARVPETDMPALVHKVIGKILA